MRKTYLDNIRSVTVVLVVLYHVIYMFNGVTPFGVLGSLRPSQPQDVFLYIVYPWFMLLLFVVSGMSARFELERRETGDFLRRRTRKLLVPSTIGLLVGGWVLGYYNMAIGHAFDTMQAVPKPILFLIQCVSGCGPLWYIQTLWLFSVLLVAIRKLEKDRLYKLGQKANGVVLLLCVFLIYGGAQILNVPVVEVYRFGIYGVGFLLGYFILSHEAVMERMEKHWYLYLALAVLSGGVFVKIYWGKSYVDHEVLDSLLCNVFAWFGTLGMLATFKKWCNAENRLFNWLHKKSWGLYIFHYLPIAMSAWYLKKLAPQTAPVFVYILVCVSGFAGALLLDAVVRRIPVLRWCLLGIKKEKKK